MESRECDRELGSEIRRWATGDDECNAYSVEYACGAVYNNNFMDIVGNRDHDCFWDCSKCVYTGEEVKS